MFRYREGAGTFPHSSAGPARPLPGDLTFAPLPGLQHLAHTKGVSPTLRDARRLIFPASLAVLCQPRVLSPETPAMGGWQRGHSAPGGCRGVLEAVTRLNRTSTERIIVRNSQWIQLGHIGKSNKYRGPVTPNPLRDPSLPIIYFFSF